MNYRKLNNTDGLSALGFGCMRLPKKGNGFDIDEIAKEVVYAVEHGVNYFDTAYIYPGSEEVLGTVLQNEGIRDRIYLATKMPHYLIKNADEAEAKFEEQLTRLKTDHIDYYLMHMLPDALTLDSLKSRGVMEWAEKKREEGKIKRIGFSYHGSSDMFIKILHGYKWDFCQIQYNYMDEHSQAGRKGLLEAAKLGIPVIIMEPLRGGRLVNNLPRKALQIMKDSVHDWTAAEWGLKWLWNQPEVTTVLSGMNSSEMVAENIRIASETSEESLSQEDMATYNAIREAISENIKVGCTGCGYCMPCPAGVDIPGCFRTYNVSYTDNFFTGLKEYFMCTTMKNEPSVASLCKKCGRCEERCPQGIKIRQELINVAFRFEKPIFKLVRKFLPGRVK